MGRAGRRWFGSPRRRRARSRQAAAGWSRPGSGAGCRAGSPRSGAPGVPPGACRPRGRSGRIPADARVVAVGVVVARDLGELGDPAGDVGRVLARVVDHRLGAVERADRAREDRLRQLGEPRLGGGQLGQVVAGAGLADQLAQVLDRRPRVGGSAGAASGRTGASCLVAGFDSSTSRWRSSSVERRFTNVVLALRSVPGSSVERPLERRCSRRRSRPSPGWCSTTRRGQVVAPRRRSP